MDRTSSRTRSGAPASDLSLPQVFDHKALDKENNQTPERKAAIARYTKKYRQAHLEKMRANYLSWAQRNVERICEYASARRALIRHVRVEQVKRAVVWERDAGICHICTLPADPLNWHLEHVVALSKGGEHSYTNCKVSHPHCNQVKYNKELFGC